VKARRLHEPCVGIGSPIGASGRGVIDVLAGQRVPRLW
jgi:hypothetical protein